MAGASRSLSYHTVPVLGEEAFLDGPGFQESAIVLIIFHGLFSFSIAPFLYLCDDNHFLVWRSVHSAPVTGLVFATAGGEAECRARSTTALGLQL